MDILQTVSTRELGNIPVSIGTALAMESCLGILPEHETDKPISNEIDILWINVRTMYRNLIGAIDKDIRNTLTGTELAETLINEMQIIETAFSHQTKGRVNITFYLCSYGSVGRRYPHAMHKSPNTPLQKDAFALEQVTMHELVLLQPSHDFREFDIDFDGEQKRALILTHYPIDLLNRYKFKSLTLLESHTGAVKSPARWYTKFHDGKTLYNIPFDRMTLQIFGDGVLFSPVNIKIKRFMVDIATKHNWSSVTTKDYIVKTIKDEHDPVLEGFVLKMY